MSSRAKCDTCKKFDPILSRTHDVGESFTCPACIKKHAAPEPVQEPRRAKHPLPSLDPYVQEFREKYGRAAQTEFYPECDDRE